MEGTETKHQNIGTEIGDCHSTKYQEIQQELKIVDVEAVKIDVDTIDHGNNEVEQPLPVFPTRSHLEIMRKGLSISPDISGFLLFFVRFIFLILSVISLIAAAPMSEIIVYIVFLGIFSILNLLYALLVNVFYLQFVKLQADDCPYNIAPIREYLQDLYNAVPVSTLELLHYYFMTCTRSVYDEGSDVSRSETYEERRLYRQKRQRFEYPKFIDISLKPSITQLTASPLIIVRSEVNFVYETWETSRLFDAQKSELKAEFCVSFPFSKDEFERHDHNELKLKDFRYQQKNLCSWDVDSLPWVLKHIQIVYIVLALLGFQWFFVIWLQGYIQQVNIQIEKYIYQKDPNPSKQVLSDVKIRASRRITEF